MAASEKVAIFEDDSRYQRFLIRELETAGHYSQVVASSAGQIPNGVKRATEEGFSVIISDGNLSSDVTGKDGDKIIGEIKKINPRIVLIGYSSEGKIRGTMKDFEKGVSLPREVVEFITNLPLRP